MGSNPEVGLKRRTRRDTLLLLVFLLTAVVLATLPHERQLMMATVLRSTLLAPIMKLRSGISDVSEMRVRLDELRDQRDSLTARLLVMQGVDEENLRLRGLMQLAKRDTSLFIPANLYPVGRSGEEIKRSFVIDVGEQEGVKRDAPVVALGGLVGVVRAAGRRQASGDFWTHPEFRVSAMTADGRVFGIIRSLPETPFLMRLDGAPFQLELRPGTPLVTSGQGGVFPRGVPIGRVAELTSAQAGWAKSYLVEPAVHPEAAREVMILLDGAGEDVTELWEAQSPDGER